MKARKAAGGQKKTLRARKSSVSTQVLTDNGMLVKRKRLSNGNKEGLAALRGK